MSLLDLLLAVVIGASVYSGFRAGLARASVGFIATILGIVFGFWFYGIPAEWFRERVGSAMAANLFGFFAVFGVTLIVGSILGQLLSKVFKWTGLSWLDRILGAGFGFVRGVLVVVALIAVLMAFTPRPVPNWMTGSALLPYALEASDWCSKLAPYEVKQAFSASLDEIRDVWKQQVERARRPAKREPKSTDQ